MGAHHKNLREPAQQTEGRGTLEHIAHFRVGAILGKAVLVIEVRKYAVNHRIAKVYRPVIGCDPACERLPNAEVPCLPRHFLPERQQATCATTHGDLPELGCRPHMKLDAARQVEAHVSGCRNPRR